MSLRLGGGVRELSPPESIACPLLSAKRLMLFWSRPPDFHNFVRSCPLRKSGHAVDLCPVTLFVVFVFSTSLHHCRHYYNVFRDVSEWADVVRSFKKNVSRQIEEVNTFTFIRLVDPENSAVSSLPLCHQIIILC